VHPHRPVHWQAARARLREAVVVVVVVVFVVVVLMVVVVVVVVVGCGSWLVAVVVGGWIVKWSW
jgi:hypothetical protein